MTHAKRPAQHLVIVRVHRALLLLLEIRQPEAFALSGEWRRLVCSSAQKEVERRNETQHSAWHKEVHREGRGLFRFRSVSTCLRPVH